VDASTAVRWVLPTPLQVKALKLRAEYQQNIHELIAPSHFPGEIASALTKAERQKLIPVGDAHLLIQDILNSQPCYTPLTRCSTERWRFPQTPGAGSTIVSTWPSPSRKTASSLRRMTSC